uniref:Ku C-terminal domain-containing protein n=1 Tax=Timema douglasi TaxID=61478 RepID=A0A7R8VPE9_TIMDO|nr:unnamed protein product [Timema douglasi]
MLQQAGDRKFDLIEEDNEVKHTSLEGMFSKDVIEVGTITPEQDFLTLLKKGEPFSTGAVNSQSMKRYTVEQHMFILCTYWKTLSIKMQDAIMKLVMHSFGTDEFIKAVAALKLLREKCKELLPNPFNQWLSNLKENLIERDKVGFWDMILKDNIGLISVVENPGSTVTEEDAEIFLRNSLVKVTDSGQDLMDAENLKRLAYTGPFYSSHCRWAALSMVAVSSGRGLILGSELAVVRGLLMWPYVLLLVRTQPGRGCGSVLSFSVTTGELKGKRSKWSIQKMNFWVKWPVLINGREVDEGGKEERDVSGEEEPDNLGKGDVVVVEENDLIVRPQTMELGQVYTNFEKTLQLSRLEEQQTLHLAMRHIVRTGHERGMSIAFPTPVALDRIQLKAKELPTDLKSLREKVEKVFADWNRLRRELVLPELIEGGNVNEKAKELTRAIHRAMRVAIPVIRGGRSTINRFWSDRLGRLRGVARKARRWYQAEVEPMRKEVLLVTYRIRKEENESALAKREGWERYVQEELRNNAWGYRFRWQPG